MNKAQLKRKCKDILNAHPIGFRFAINSVEFKFLMRVFQGHPEFLIKKGAGIASIYITKGEVYKTRCFALSRIDGSETDISYIRSIDGATTKISDIKCACRTAISPLIAEFRNRVNIGSDRCPVTGDVLTVETLHIDHYDSDFETVFKTWVSKYDIDTLHASLNDATVDGEQAIFFTSKAIIVDFISHHNSNTNLRAVSKRANLSILRKNKAK